MFHRSLLSLATAGVCFTLAAGSWAHITLKSPLQRGGLADTNQKTGPCGKNGPRSDITYLESGSKIVVQWDETINHPGHFRISFDKDGTNFVDPTGYDDFTTDPATLLEGNIVDDNSGSVFSQEITLPDIECDNCTLQLIQVMSDKPPWGPAGGNELYYRCADLVLTKAVSPTGSGSGGASNGSGGASNGGGGSGGNGNGGSGGTTGSGGAGGAGAGGDGSGGKGSNDSGGGCSVAGGGNAGLPFAGLLIAGLLAAHRRRSFRRGSR